jgi:hypothetical protein
MNTIDLGLIGLVFAKPHSPSPATELASEVPSSPIERLRKWRAEHGAEFRARRVEGMKRSSAVRENLLRLHREKKAEWRASAMRNPKLRATDQHIAAKMWTVISPIGVKHTFRNLKKWVRENPDLFDVADVEWKTNNGRNNQDWCRAFQGIARLRPGNSKFISEWQGWRWCEEADTLPTPAQAPIAAAA